MGQRRNIIIGAVSTLLCGLAAQARAQGVVLPDGKGKAEFVHNCVGVCHRAEMVVAAKKTPEDWRKSVDDMASRGTDGTKDDLDKVVLYLVTNYATDKPGTAPGGRPAPPVFPHLSVLVKPSDFQRMRFMLTETSHVQAIVRSQGKSALKMRPGPENPGRSS